MAADLNTAPVILCWNFPCVWGRKMRLLGYVRICMEWNGSLKQSQKAEDVKLPQPEFQSSGAGLVDNNSFSFFTCTYKLNNHFFQWYFDRLSIQRPWSLCQFSRKWLRHLEVNIRLKGRFILSSFLGVKRRGGIIYFFIHSSLFQKPAAEDRQVKDCLLILEVKEPIRFPDPPASAPQL